MDFQSNLVPGSTKRYLADSLAGERESSLWLESFSPSSCRNRSPGVLASPEQLLLLVTDTIIRWLHDHLYF